MRESGPVKHRVIAAIALIGIAAISPAALALQVTQTQSIASADLFWPFDPTLSGPDATAFRPGGVDRLLNIVRQAQPPGSQCPTEVEFVVFESLPDPLMSVALAQARLDTINRALARLGPAVRVTGRTSGGLVSMVTITVRAAKDNEAPKLDTNSVPRKGSRVEAGDEITVTMVALDHANLWQSGIKTLQLVADSEGGRFVASENFPSTPSGCTALPPERRVVATYTVPSCDPPPIVRLSALVEDQAGLMDTDAAEFPVERQDGDECQDEDEGRDAGGKQDAGPCTNTWIMNGREVSFPCP